MSLQDKIETISEQTASELSDVIKRENRRAEEAIIENKLVGTNDYEKRYVYLLDPLNCSFAQFDKLLGEWKYQAYIKNLKRYHTFNLTSEFVIAKKIKLFEKVKYFPQKTFKYCQSQIEGRKKCDNQCNHCKEYYKTL